MHEGGVRAWSALGSNGAGDGALNSYVNALAVSGTDLYVGGYFTDAAGIATADSVARWGLGAVVRDWGPDRFATAAAISAATFSIGVSVAYVAYAYNFPDALAGAAVAGTIKGPVLLLDTNLPLNGATTAELTRLGPGRIVVLGGAAVISDAVMAALAGYLGP